MLKSFSIAFLLGCTPAFALAAPVFEARAPIAYLVDLSSGATLLARDADRPIPPASMAKMMTVHVIFDMIARGELDPAKLIEVRSETWKAWHAAGSTMFLSPGERVSVDNLLKGIVTLSGNDACVVLAEGVAGSETEFARRMNVTAQRLGLRSSRFGNATGWPDGGATRVTARDLATLAKATIENHPALYRRYYAIREFTWGRVQGSGAAITQPNRDPLLGRVEGADGLKTGHTEEAGYGFTGSAMQNGRRLVMVVAGLGSSAERAAESVALMEWGFKAWTTKPLFAKGKRVETADVQLGDAATVGLVAPRNLAVTFPAGESANMRVKVVYDGPIKAPIKAGQHIADLVVTTPETGEQVMPLVAEAAVGEAGFFGRIWAALKSLVGV